MNTNDLLQKALNEAVDRAVTDVLPTVRKAVKAGVLAALTSGENDEGLVSLADSIPAPGETREPYSRGKSNGHSEEENPRRLTVAEAAKIAKVELRTVYAAIKGDRLKASKKKVPPGVKGSRGGKVMVIDNNDLKAWIASRN